MSFSFGAPLTTPTSSLANAPAGSSTGFSFGGFGTSAAPSTSTNTAGGLGSTVGAFGAPAPAASGNFSFGQSTSAPATTAPFGAPSSTISNAFGSTAAAPASSGFSFGQSTTPSATTGFGAASTAPTASSTGSAFGFGQSSTTATPAASSGFGFGQSAANPQAGTGTTNAFGGLGGFGSSATPATGGFGSSFGTTTGTTPTTSTAGFGSGFGTTSAPATGGFGSSGSQPSGGFGSTGFGASTSLGGFSGISTPSTSSMFNPAASAAQPSSETMSAARFREIQQLYAPAVDQSGRFHPVDGTQGTIPNKACEFQTVMYRFREGPAVANRKPEGVSMLKWEQMESDNPNPELLVPVVEVGIHALKRRFEHQNAESKILYSYVGDMNESLQAIEQSIVKSGLRFDQLETKQAILNNKLLALLAKVEVLRCRNVPLTVDELKLYKRLQKLMMELQGPQNKLLALMNAQAHLKKHRRAAPNSLGANDVTALKLTLQRQRDSIESLTATLRKDASSLELMRRNATPAATGSLKL